MEQAHDMLLQFLPLLFWGWMMTIPAALLAREKGRSVLLWVLLALIPIVNFAAVWYFVGTPDKRVKDKLDQLLARESSARGD